MLTKVRYASQLNKESTDEKLDCNAYIITWVINQMTIIHQCCVFLLPFFAQWLSAFLVQKTLHTNSIQSQRSTDEESKPENVQQMQ